MQLTDLQTAVYNITNRPDLVNETWTAIQAATLKAHQSDYYYKDLYETGLSFPTADYSQSLQYRSLVPLYRSLKYLRKFPTSAEQQLYANLTVQSMFAVYSNPVNGVPTYDGTNTATADIKIIELENFRDYFHMAKQDVCYLAGQNIQIWMHQQIQNFLFGCYVNPQVGTQQSYSSWIALDCPFAIIYEAAAQVFKMIGKDEEAAAYRTIVPEQIELLRASNIVGNGY